MDDQIGIYPEEYCRLRNKLKKLKTWKAELIQDIYFRSDLDD